MRYNGSDSRGSKRMPLFEPAIPLSEPDSAAQAGVSLRADSPLDKFLKECQDKTPLERAKILETTSLFADLHHEAASGGQTNAAGADMNTNLHFTCFVQAPSVDSDGEMRLIELNGDRAGPLDRGPSTDLLKVCVCTVMRCSPRS